MSERRTSQLQPPKALGRWLPSSSSSTISIGQTQSNSHSKGSDAGRTSVRTSTEVGASVGASRPAAGRRVSIAGVSILATFQGHKWLSLGSSSSNNLQGAGFRRPGGPASKTATGATATTEACTSHLQGDLLRAVKVHKVMRRLGSVWDNSVGSVDQERRHFALSEPVGQIDDFISHDWGTSRWSKLLVLSFVYNARIATLASLAVSVSLLLLIALGLLPAVCVLETRAELVDQSIDVCLQVFFLPCGCVVFWLAFLWAEWAKAIARCGSRVAFVDKACIDQTDLSRKRRGILSLAGFLGRSDRLLVLWTSRYFTRLWCVYELATWLHIAEKGGFNFGEGLVFMPVSKAALLIMLQVCFIGLCPSLYGSQMFAMSSYIDWSWSAVASTGVTMTLGLWAFSIFSRESVRDLSDLPVQVSNFSIRRSKCFCCCNKHLHPLTQKSLPCDRRLIYTALRRWFSDENLETEAAVLDCFDSLVRVLVQRHILARAAFSRMTYLEALMTCLPLILFQLDIMCASGFPHEVSRRRWVYGIAMSLFTYPSGLKATILVIVELNRFGFRFEHLVSKYVISLGVGAAAALVGLVVQMPLWVATSAFDHTAPMWCALVLYGLLCVSFFAPWSKRNGTTADEMMDEPVRAVLERCRSTRMTNETPTGSSAARTTASATTIGRLEDWEESDHFIEIDCEGEEEERASWESESCN